MNELIGETVTPHGYLGIHDLVDHEASKLHALVVLAILGYVVLHVIPLFLLLEQQGEFLLCLELLDDTCHYLALIKQLSAPTPSNALLLKAFWDQVTGIRKGMKYQEVPVNRLLEVIGHLRYMGFVTGTYTDIATCLQQELRFKLKNLRNMEKCLKEGFYCADPTNDKYLPTPISRLLTALFPATQEE